METGANIPKLEVFDVLRGIAILAVFGYHWHIGMVDQYVSHDGVLMSFSGVTWNELYASFSPLNYGSAGVQLFLIISGFLIHYQFLQRGDGKLNIRRFFLRRFWRIYPPYLIVVLFFAFHDKERSIYHLFTDEGRLSLVTHLFMVHNLSGNNGIFFGINPSFWSIALEVQLYLIYPIFLILAGKIGIRRFCSILLLIHLGALVIIYLSKGGMPDKLSEMTFAGHYWIMWAAGALVAEEWHHQRRLIRISWLGWSALAAAYVLLQVFLLLFVYVSDILEAFLFAALVELCLHEPPKIWPWFRNMLISIGLCSYSIYLIHQPVIEPLMNYINWFDSSRFTPFLNGALVFGIVFLISWGMYQFLEQPSIKIGQKLAGSSRAK